MRIYSFLVASRRHPVWFVLFAMFSGSPEVVTVAKSTDSQAEIHALLIRQYCVPSEHQSGASGLRLERAAILKNVNVSVRLNFHCWMEKEQRVIIQFLLRRNANADDAHRSPQAQFSHDAGKFEVSDAGVSSSDKGQKISMMIHDRVAS
jgi:hypothetical protein